MQVDMAWNIISCLIYRVLTRLITIIKSDCRLVETKETARKKLKLSSTSRKVKHNKKTVSDNQLIHLLIERREQRGRDSGEGSHLLNFVHACKIYF